VQLKRECKNTDLSRSDLHRHNPFSDTRLRWAAIWVLPLNVACDGDDEPFAAKPASVVVICTIVVLLLLRARVVSAHAAENTAIVFEHRVRIHIMKRRRRGEISCTAA
jgi:hypothetical protein